MISLIILHIFFSRRKILSFLEKSQTKDLTDTGHILYFSIINQK